MENRDCSSCRQCNHKGKPSVTKYSLYCDKNHAHNIERFSLFEKIKERLFELRFNKKEKTLKQKGFRDSYFYR